MAKLLGLTVKPSYTNEGYKLASLFWDFCTYVVHLNPSDENRSASSQVVSWAKDFDEILRTGTYKYEQLYTVLKYYSKHYNRNDDVFNGSYIPKTFISKFAFFENFYISRFIPLSEEGYKEAEAYAKKVWDAKLCCSVESICCSVARTLFNVECVRKAFYKCLERVTDDFLKKIFKESIKEVFGISIYSYLEEEYAINNVIYRHNTRYGIALWCISIERMCEQISAVIYGKCGKFENEKIRVFMDNVLKYAEELRYDKYYGLKDDTHRN